MNSILPAEQLTLETLFGTLFEPAIWADPAALYHELRARSPVARIDDHQWVVSSHSAVQALLRDPQCSSDEQRTTGYAPPPDDHYPAEMHELLVFTDPPDHTRIRRLVVRAFTPRQVQLIEPRAVELVDALLDEAIERGRFDVVRDLGHPLAVQIICELLGVPFADREEFSEWGSALARTVDPSVLRTPEQDIAAGAAAHAFADYFDGLIEQRHRAPTDDLLSELVAAEHEGDRLDRGELISICLLLLVAGYETTVSLVGNGFVALMNHRDEFRRLAAEPSLLPTAVNELLRFDSPVQMVIRVAVEPIELDGITIPAGDSLIPFLGAANRDPAVFVRPDELRVDRVENPHVAFGGGIHHCLGAALARVEAQAAFEGLARRLPDVGLVETTRRPTFTLRGYSSVVANVSGGD